MRSALVLCLLALPLSAQVERIDIIATSHTDVGYTDQPSVTRELQKRYLDIAIDECLRTAKRPAGERFYWTAESTLSVLDWWNDASPARRREFLQAVDSGQLDVASLACNNTPFMDAQEWAASARWLPDDLWKRVAPSVAMQDDVNGFPRAGAMQLLDRGVHRLLTGINVDSGGRPFPAPHAFWWKLPDGRRLFVYEGEHYGTAYRYFESKEWLQGGSAANGSQRPPHPGEILRTDEASLRAANKLCRERLAKLEAGGYRLSRMIMSFTNQWRWDNDPPFPALTDFIVAWNRLGLKPALRFTTAAVALADLEKEAGATLPVYEGEWTDWWANGSASGPREVAASRAARRSLRAAQSEVWGPMPTGGLKAVDEVLRDLVLFDEHTWGADSSVSQPASLNTLAQFTEKSMLAYKPMGRAQFLLATRLRTKLAAEPEGLYAVNTASVPVSGWVRFQRNGARREFRTVDGAPVYDDGAGYVKFWARDLAPGVHRFRFDGDGAAPASSAAPEIRTDANGWPESIRWSGMERPLFLAGFGDFLAVEANAPRSVVASLAAGNSSDRSMLKEVPARAARTTEVQTNPYTTVYTQALEHPRLKSLVRRLEVWNGEPRARLTVTLDRLSSVEPETFYVNFPLPAEGVLPVISSGGVPFTPFKDQLGETCRDYFALDGWARYTTPAGEWLWVTRDAAMVTVGGPNTLARLKEPPREPNRLMAMLFNNHWHTNFVADEHGLMEFQFDLVWKKRIENPDALADALAADPLVLIVPAAKPDPLFLRDLWRP